MKTRSVVILAVLLIGAATAADGRSENVVPKPRARLDPATRAEPPKQEKREAPDSVLSMSPFVVKSTMLTSTGPEEERRPAGPFSPLTGGTIARKDNGGVRIETGVWPYHNILWKADRFKSDLNHVGTEFVKVSW